MNTETVGLTKGELFKKRNGFSRTMARNMKKSEVKSVEEYRELRSEKRKQQRKIVKMKKDKARVGRSGKVKLTGKKKPSGKR